MLPINTNLLSDLLLLQMYHTTIGKSAFLSCGSTITENKCTDTGFIINFSSLGYRAFLKIKKEFIGKQLCDLGDPRVLAQPFNPYPPPLLLGRSPS